MFVTSLNDIDKQWSLGLSFFCQESEAKDFQVWKRVDSLPSREKFKIQGRQYQVVEVKRQALGSSWERICRLVMALFCVLFSCGLALISQKIRQNLMGYREVKIVVAEQEPAVSPEPSSKSTSAVSIESSSKSTLPDDLFPEERISLHELCEINQEKIGDAPTPIQFPTQLQLNSVNLLDFLNLFDEVCCHFNINSFNDVDDKNDQCQPRWKDNARYQLREMLEFRERSSLSNSLESLLKALWLEIEQRPELSWELKRKIVEDLTLVSFHCEPAQYEVTESLYLIFYSQGGVEEIVKRAIQQSKESIFQYFYGASIEPVMLLNRIREGLGVTLGLNKSEVHLADKHKELGVGIHIENGERIHHSEFDEFLITFYQQYTPETLLYRMGGLLNQQFATQIDSKAEIQRFIYEQVLFHLTGFPEGTELSIAENELIRKYALDEEQIFNLESLVLSPYVDLTPGEEEFLKLRGVFFLLVHFGILLPSVPNVHVVSFSGNA